MEILVEAALVDWSGISDRELPAVCARARTLAAAKPNKFAMATLPTTADVLRARDLIAEEHRVSEYRRNKANYELAVKEGRVVPEVTPKDLREEERENFWTEFYKSAGIPRPQEESARSEAK